ncbi:hypothetical protein BDA99DRAFT_493523 [Phascolomyces articulosus]|uniref:Uncharacterized protein n=1 Tax=Phascolomyces articulosus TaxID=60185 RepID=A0AAD5PMY9_9FUNG|nr:hypothetical protein BDA99DRAFT_493523 [Phascolomyces articulosus]
MVFEYIAFVYNIHKKVLFIYMLLSIAFLLLVSYFVFGELENRHHLTHRMLLLSIMAPY